MLMLNCLQDGAEYDSYGNRIRHKKVQLNYNTGYNNQVVKTKTCLLEEVHGRKGIKDTRPNQYQGCALVSLAIS